MVREGNAVLGTSYHPEKKNYVVSDRMVTEPHTLSQLNHQASQVIYPEKLPFH